MQVEEEEKNEKTTFGMGINDLLVDFFPVALYIIYICSPGLRKRLPSV